MLRVMMNRLLSAVVAAACVASAWAVDTSSDRSTSERLVTVRQAIDARDWDRGMAELNQMLRDEPRNADVHNLLGYSYRKRPQPDLAKAFEHYRIALRLNPRHTGAHEYIGEAYLLDRKPEQAEEHLAQLERICGNKRCEEYQDLARAIAEYRAKNR